MVQEALEVHLVMTAPVLRIADRGTFGVHHTLLGGSLNLATMDNNWNIIGLQ